MGKTISRRAFLYTGITTLSLAAAGGGSTVYPTQIEPAWIEVTQQRISLSRLGTDFAGYRIVQISDIHSDLVWTDQERVEEVVQLVNEQQPDLVVITGDFISGLANSKNLAALSPLRSLRARDGVFAVLGNHDHAGGAAQVRDMLHTYGVYELNNASHTIKRGDSKLHVVGLDDLLLPHDQVIPIWSYKPLLDSILRGLPAAGETILLVHEPDFADVAATMGRIGLQLSGHSHGGQIRIPFYGPLALPALGERYPQGLYRTGNMLHYTNRGIGMVAPRVRFNCRPEITVFTCHTA